MARLPKRCMGKSGEELEACIREEIADKCESAGIAFETMTKQYNAYRLAPVNVGSMVAKRHLEAPYSELCLHVGCAGARLVDMGITKDGRSGFIVFQREDGTCGYTDGGSWEVMDKELIEAFKRIYRLSD